MSRCGVRLCFPCLAPPAVLHGSVDPDAAATACSQAHCAACGQAPPTGLGTRTARGQPADEACFQGVNLQRRESLFCAAAEETGEGSCPTMADLEALLKPMATPAKASTYTCVKESLLFWLFPV